MGQCDNLNLTFDYAIKIESYAPKVIVQKQWSTLREVLKGTFKNIVIQIS
jgi:hypothetical protein